MRIGVLRGGVGHEYEVSLQSGATVLNNLPANYQKHDLLITKDGTWHCGGVPVRPGELVRKVDLIFNALHGEYGEDGQVQKVLDQIGIPYTGPQHMGAVQSMNKLWTKALLEKQGIATPLFSFVRKGEDVVEQAREIFRRIPPPWIVKPADKGSSVGVYLAKNLQELVGAIEACAEYTDSILIEEFINGKEATCGVIDNFRGQQHYALVPVEIRTPPKTIFSYELKYGGQAQELCPGSFSKEETAAIERLAVATHKLLGLRHYSRTDFIVARGRVYVLECNSLPGLTEQSLLPKSLDAIGCRLEHFFDHIIKQAR